ncbi:hypothetical protein K437DRAFT_294161 [Tilletiaria anomala UBC 951]|uniref:G-patch domain-containing protein n=1 Tax=Tilletiaria anomala (strain ATCC 24038 / CBS 436.72 / UBC 951) TaxID=1037660 RepID=A0A066W345_TILAU|nr:uncharacterized protein K437DRAFT_294161 [Tilletiaria anomala UBC 951]KDN46963.1 hypothetical protein K437DRAFT_294161 [Tilletiaria anomala UBC 951]
MALRQAKRRKIAFEGEIASDAETSALALTSASAVKSSRSNFSPTDYLIQHGWQGAGVPLDGKNGKGLKKPLALPQKRDVKGLGKNRDRAVEWWDCLFEASAKTLAIGPTTTPSTAPSSGIATATIISSEKSLSLHATAKREVARRQLMSGFIRGEVIGGSDISKKGKEASSEPKGSASMAFEVVPRSGATDKQSSSAKAAKKAAREQRKAEKAARKLAREEKRQRKESRRLRKAAKHEAAAATVADPTTLCGVDGEALPHSPTISPTNGFPDSESLKDKKKKNKKRVAKGDGPEGSPADVGRRSLLPDSTPRSKKTRRKTGEGQD